MVIVSMVAKLTAGPLRRRVSAVARMAAMALTLTAVAAGAQEPSANAVKIAREILDIKKSGVLFTPMVPGVIERIKLMHLQTNPTLRKDLDEVAANLRKVFAPRAEQLMTEIAKLYASRFSEAELKEILAFYRTPTGKKVIDAEPQIFEDAMEGLKDWQEKFAEEVMPRFRAEMKKRGHDL